MNTDGHEVDDVELEGQDPKKLSKGQLKKLKEKQKKAAAAGTTGGEKEAETKAPETQDSAKVEEQKNDEAEEKGDAKGKDKKKAAKKPMNAAAKIALQRMEEQKKLDDERKKLEEELRKKEEEERRKEEEEERKLKEIEEAKRKAKEEKIQKLKEEGKYKSKKEREREEALIKRREEMIAAGLVPADHFDNPEEKPKTRVVRTKRPKVKKEETQEDKEETQATEETEQQEVPEKKEELESWEAMYENDTTKATVADDWESMDQAAPTKKKEAETKPAAPTKAKEEKITKPAEESKQASGKSATKTKVEEKPVETKPKETPKEESKSAQVEKPKEALPETHGKLGNSNFRSPIICILGHVDTGKTKLLDKMRNTNVQEGEAGGITQQIGATFFPYEKLEKEVEKLKTTYPVDLQIPGLLIIDTPGHESFSNLRSRGSGLCDIAVLVVDIMHGLEKQTLESIELLKFRKTPFVIALNKIDRLYGWKSKPDTSSYQSLKKQDKNVQLEFRDRSKAIITELTEKGFNVALYYDNPDPNTYVSIIPTSAVTGEGISDIMSVAINLTQKWLKKKITKKDEFKCTVLEVKVLPGLGASIDVMLVDGTLHEGDKIVLAGYEGAIVTSVRALLTPHPMKEMRVNNEYIHHKSISGAMGIKISANDLDKALAGSELYIAKNEEEEQMYKKLCEEEIAKVKKSIKLVEEGVLVAASTLGSLEALLQFLKSSSIPVSSISIGPVSKAEVIKAMKPLTIEEGEIKKEYATILAFDVKVLQDAKDLAEQEGVKIFTANIIYHLFDHFTAYIKEIKEERKRNEGKLAVFPCILKPVAFFNTKDPIIMGIDVVEGQMRLGTPICSIEKGKFRIGTVESIEKEHKPLQVARPSDGSVAVKFKGDSTILAGRHFELKDRLCSIISRESIDALKKYFRDEMSKSDWELVKKMKPLFNIA